MEQLTQEQIEALQKAYAALEADHLKALEQIESLQQENASHKSEVAALEKKLDALSKAYLDLENTIAPAEEKKPAPSFEYKGKKYEVITPLIDIPLIGIRTALEVTQDEAAQKYLVETPGNIGIDIREISKD